MPSMLFAVYEYIFTVLLLDVDQTLTQVNHAIAGIYMYVRIVYTRLPGYFHAEDCHVRKFTESSSRRRPR
jgi:hypothetical protein